MGLLDETLKQLTQNSNLSQPLQVVLQDLLQGKTQGNVQPATPDASSAQGPSGPCAGLGSLISQLEAAGLSDAVKSWVGTGRNMPVAPSALGSALGAKTVVKMADQAGVSKEDLLTELARALPGLIDKLTGPNQAGPSR